MLRRVLLAVSVGALLAFTGAALAGCGPAKETREMCVITSYSIHYTKLYDAGKPILAITDPTGETGRLISQHGLGVVCDFSEVESIKQGWRQFVNHCLSADWRFPLSSSEVSVFSREHRAMEMMQLAKELI